jgi:TPR repeat protein
VEFKTRDDPLVEAGFFEAHLGAGTGSRGDRPRERKASVPAFAGAVRGGEINEANQFRQQAIHYRIMNKRQRSWGISLMAGAVMLGGIVYYAVCVFPTNEVHSNPAPGRIDVDQKAVAARASAGDPQAQLQMGILGLEKAIRPGEYREAGDWLRQAAEAGMAEAQYQLGALYQSGRLAGQDPTNTVFWLEQAAAQRHVAALYNLGSMYGTGRGVTRDPGAAVRYFRQAAELGDAYAQYNLARRCEDGQGTATDLVEAWKWYALAGSGGIASAKDGKHALESRLTAQQLEHARLSLEQFRKQAAALRK